MSSPLEGLGLGEDFGRLAGAVDVSGRAIRIDLARQVGRRLRSTSSSFPAGRVACPSVSGFPRSGRAQLGPAPVVSGTSGRLVPEIPKPHRGLAALHRQSRTYPPSPETLPPPLAIRPDLDLRADLVPVGAADPCAAAHDDQPPRIIHFESELFVQREQRRERFVRDLPARRQCQDQDSLNQPGTALRAAISAS